MRGGALGKGATAVNVAQNPGTVFHSAKFQSNFRRKDMERVLLFLRSLKGKDLPAPLRAGTSSFAKMVLTSYLPQLCERRARVLSPEECFW